MGPRGASGISTFRKAARNASRSSTLPPTAWAASLIHLPAEGIVDGDGHDLLVTEGRIDPLPERVRGLARGPSSPHHPLRRLALREIVGGDDRVKHGDLIFVDARRQGIADMGKGLTDQNLDVI